METVLSPMPLQTHFRPAMWVRGAEGPARPGAGGVRNFSQNRLVYTVISQRARGLSIGVNMNPDQSCNFDCAYCEVDRRPSMRDRQMDLERMGEELRSLLALEQAGRIRELPGYHLVPEELLKLREVALSGDGEPTLCPDFVEVVQSIIHIRASGTFPFFKIVLVTNSTGLHRPEVQRGLELFGARDEVWAKLDAGTQGWLDKVNRPNISLLSCPNVSLEQVLSNILLIGRQRPVIIQSLFPRLEGEGPPEEEIEQYVHRLRELKEGGARISLVQVYSVHRTGGRRHAGHLPLSVLSHIARRVREVAGLNAEVF